ncbi:isochorismate synthase [Bacillaceae bacterium SIJ1]|uniref:isochorismate synthase n=1 Tax=Litoribacterium kuwaitense TaxID=1398745 RepID=UPI0013EDA2D3|nr:isochorismate synthase [Litoribacterium kuwaitense]NGP44240.1 isochorismate synthase [Litoribacterium kuwaitense]
MIDKSQQSLSELLAEASGRAKQMQTPILASWTELIEAVDLLDFFHEAAYTHNDRFFWRGQDGITIAACGACELFESDHDHLHEIEDLWKERMTYSVKNTRRGPLTGPHLFGGLSYHGEPSKGSVWQGFSPARFILPEIVITREEEHSWFTFNCLITEETDLTDIWHRMTAYKNKIAKLSAREFDAVVFTDILNPHLTEWKEAIASLTPELGISPLQKVVLARKKEIRTDRPLAAAFVLEQLLSNHDGGYIFAVSIGERTFLGATPEQLIKKKGHVVESACVAGTIRAGQTEAESHALGQALLSDEKNLEEHAYVVHNIAEHISSIAENITVPTSPRILKAGNVQHLFTPVRGISYSEQTVLSMARLLHPTPALGGTPTDLALQKIKEVEPEDRGWYAAPIGWMDMNGDGEFAVAIRSGVIEQNRASLFAGCGIVQASNPEEEAEEVELKFLPMLQALRGTTL